MLHYSLTPRRIAALLVLTALLVACTPEQPLIFSATQTPESTGDASAPLLVAAAADLRFAFSEIGELFTEETGQEVKFVFGSTGNLTTQIENGAPFDAFAAANIAYIDRLKDQGLIIPETQQLYAQGRIVLAVNRQAGIEATGLEDLLSPAITHIAIANPNHAPYGVAAQQALQSAGLWDAVQPRLVLGEDVRQTLQFVQTGDAPVGIVALSVANVPEISYSLIPAEMHNPLKQSMAVVASTSRADTARAFLDFVQGAEGRTVMKHYGFLLPGEFQ